MKKLSYSLTSLSLLVALAGLSVISSCTQEELLEPQEESSPAFEIVGEPVDAYLSITVGGLDASLTTRSEEAEDTVDEDTDAEKQVNDLWVFQYDATDKKLIMIPQYLTITKQEQLADLQVRLSNNDGNSSIIYVVTNTADSTWVKYNSTTGSYSGFMTLADLEANNLPNPRPEMLVWNGESYVKDGEATVSIPMNGSEEADVSADETIKVNVERMFAKLFIKVDLSNFNTTDYDGALVYNVTVGSIPYYCRVSSLGSEDQVTAADYSACGQWVERTFSETPETETDFYPYVIYVPENIQGETEKKSETDKTQNIPVQKYNTSTSYNSDALAVVIRINAMTKDGATMGPYAFYGYPGGNGVNNFNVRRNCIYKVSMRIDNLNEDDLVLPSANCIVCLSDSESDKTTTFFPYCRPETGGGYSFTDYVNNDWSAADDSKRIATVEIVWQSENSAGNGGFLGDNSDSENPCVWISAAPTEGDTEAKTKAEYRRMIYVKVPANEVGNALIAAKNSSGHIIWSWHIWSRKQGDDPSNGGIEYYTYSWSKSGIRGYKDSEGNLTGYPRIAGYTVMSCNLGALTGTPTSTYGTETYGTVYQWGRKDPFPPVTNQTGSGGTYCDYTIAYTANYYGNDGTTLVTMTSNSGITEDDGYLFYSVEGKNRTTTIGTTFNDYMGFSIANPTVFICGTNTANLKNSSYVGGGYSQSSSTVQSILQNYYPEPHDGNWIYDDNGDHYNSLWGGLDPEDETLDIECFDTGYTDKSGNPVHLYDDYGDEKSIFDPCPYGWRVSPPDLWLGFTDTGLNVTSVSSQVNYSSYANRGFNMYMVDWKSGTTSFFPCQGARAPDGSGTGTGSCGNYNNATADANDRTNILHLHNNNDYFHIFENSILQFYIKSTASPVRCVNTASVSSSSGTTD